MSYKIVMIIPYFGKFPSSFKTWIKSCENNKNIDWIIITDNDMENKYSTNIRVIKTSFEEICFRIQKKFDFKISLQKPYKLCDFKPAYGYIFYEDIKEYDFWGHCDMDMIFGDISFFITDKILKKYKKIMTKGHFTLYKNTKEINEIFKKKNKYIDYKEVYSQNLNFGFDEGAINYIFDKNDIYNSELYIDILPTGTYFINMLNKDEKVFSYEENKMAYRVIADHIRTVTFALADGAMFDNAGRGYVLRRILRRAVRYGKQIGIEKAFMYDLVPLVCDMMKDFYDYLPEKQDFISTMVKKEEEAFHKTLLNGEKLLKSLIDKNENGEISGKDAFKLYDTYGFPFELTLEIAEESNLTVNEEEFKEELKIQQERSRASRDNNESMASQKPDLMAFVEPSTFVYDLTSVQGKVIGLFKDGVKTDEITDKGEVIFDTTPFYAEMGGQCGDTGSLDNETTHANVVNTLNAPNKQHMHFVEVKEGAIHLGDTFTLSIDQQKRRQITANHSATHILQKALQETLGDHISQAGSYVDDKVLRFDFTHFEKISAELLKEIEEKVNQIVFEGRPVVIKNMTKEEALASGAMALFDEKYGDVVRVVNIGDYSIELCGGCHVSNSSEIGLFKIVSEESVGSGIRRIVAQSGLAAYNAMVHEKETVDTIASTLNLKNRKDVINKVEALKEDLKEAKAEIEQLSAKLNAIQAASKANDIEEINGVKVLYVEEQLENAKAKQLTFDFRDQLESGIVVLVSKYEEKCSYFVSVSKDLVGQYKAGNIIKAINEVVDGRGGGKPDFAQGGCAINDNISKIKGALKNIL